MAISRGQNGWKKMVAMMLFGVLVMVSGQVMANDDTSPPSETKAIMEGKQQCEQVVALLQEQNKKNDREFRQLKRDIAALSQKMETPGVSEILGGIGYILGIFGVAAYVMSRKKDVSGGH